MEPLIKLREPAKARIKAKEAQAEREAESVRQAIKYDLFRAEKMWGGYFDLHSDHLDGAHSSARDLLDQERAITAQFIFLAHSTEYRRALRNPMELEPVLANLREALIRQYGEHTRTAVQCQEAKEMEKAWNEATEPSPNGTRLRAACEQGTESIESGEVIKKTRAETVAKLIKELDILKPQMFEDESEYRKIRAEYGNFLAFEIAEKRPNLKRKILAIQGSRRHIRLAQELAAAHYGRELATVRDDWKKHKPMEFKRSQ